MKESEGYEMKKFFAIGAAILAVIAVVTALFRNSRKEGTQDWAK